MSNDTERDARLRLYAEVGDSRQYLGPQDDEHAARTLLRADVASLLKERDALSADYAAAVRALRNVETWRGGAASTAPRSRYPYSVVQAVLSTQRAKEVE